MLRGLLALLVLANVLFLAWAQGWLGLPAPQQGQREGGRIGAQLRPEAVTVVPARDTGVAVARSAAQACMEAGPYGDADVAAAEARLKAAGLPEGSWTREPVPAAGGWILFAGRYPDAAARRAREDELRRLGLPPEPVDAPPELAPGLALSRHASRDAAELALAAVADRPLTGLRVVAVPASAQQHWLRAPAADAALQGRLFALDLGFRPCVAPR